MTELDNTTLGALVCIIYHYGLKFDYGTWRDESRSIVTHAARNNINFFTLYSTYLARRRGSGSAGRSGGQSFSPPLPSSSSLALYLCVVARAAMCAWWNCWRRRVLSMCPCNMHVMCPTEEEAIDAMATIEGSLWDFSARSRVQKPASSWSTWGESSSRICNGMVKM